MIHGWTSRSDTFKSPSIYSILAYLTSAFSLTHMRHPKHLGSWISEPSFNIPSTFISVASSTPLVPNNTNGGLLNLWGTPCAFSPLAKIYQINCLEKLPATDVLQAACSTAILSIWSIARICLKKNNCITAPVCDSIIYSRHANWSQYILSPQCISHSFSFSLFTEVWVINVLLICFLLLRHVCCSFAYQCLFPRSGLFVPMSKITPKPILVFLKTRQDVKYHLSNYCLTGSNHSLVLLSSHNRY